MSRLPRLPLLVLALCLGCLGLAAPGSAQTVGSPNVVTADPPVPRPSTTPCAVQLYSGFTFADFSPKPFTYTPPAACPGPWAKVVLEADFAVTTGRQFDRTAQIAVGHVNIYYGTTQEPSQTVSPSWHVERDLTDYSALFRTPQSGEVNLGNLVDSTFTGILSGSARLLFYPAAGAAPRTPDVVLPLSTNPGGAELLATSSSVLAPSLSLPTNIEAAYLDVISQSQSSDEFWFTCVPDDVSDLLFSCPGTSFRETQVTIDGQPAGVAPVYPWLFTGAVDPLAWRPIVGVQTLNFVPYRVDLTPFAALLSDGQPHQVGVSVYNANNYFLVAATLLLHLDAGSAQVTGAVTRNTLTAPQPAAIREDLAVAADGSVTGTVSTESERQFTVSGYVDTSHGRVETTVRQKLRFSNEQELVISETQYTQKIAQSTRITSSTQTKRPGAVDHVESHASWPLDLDIHLIANPDGSIDQTLTVDQSYDVHEAGGAPRNRQVSNNMKTTDTLLFATSGAVTGFRDRRSSQTYSARDTDGYCYHRAITAADGLLTSVHDGQGCGGRQ